MAERLGPADGGLHHDGAEPLTLDRRIDGERAQEKRRAPLAGLDVPQAQGADEPAPAGRGEGETAGRQTPLAQALGGFGPAVAGKARVEQALARRDVLGEFRADLDHRRALPGSSQVTEQGFKRTGPFAGAGQSPAKPRGFTPGPHQRA